MISDVHRPAPRLPRPDPPRSAPRLPRQGAVALRPFKPTFTIELANGYNGCLPAKEQHALAGYETWRARSSYLEVDAAAKIAEKALGLLGELAQRAESR